MLSMVERGVQSSALDILLLYCVVLSCTVLILDTRLVPFHKYISRSERQFLLRRSLPYSGHPHSTLCPKPHTHTTTSGTRGESCGELDGYRVQPSVIRLYTVPYVAHQETS